MRYLIAALVRCIVAGMALGFMIAFALQGRFEWILAISIPFEIAVYLDKKIRMNDDNQTAT